MDLKEIEREFNKKVLGLDKRPSYALTECVESTYNIEDFEKKISLSPDYLLTIVRCGIITRTMEWYDMISEGTGSKDGLSDPVKLS